MNVRTDLPFFGIGETIGVTSRFLRFATIGHGRDWRFFFPFSLPSFLPSFFLSFFLSFFFSPLFPSLPFRSRRASWRTAKGPACDLLSADYLRPMTENNRCFSFLPRDIYRMTLGLQLIEITVNNEQ